MSEDLLFSLIVATAGADRAIDRLLESLAAQTLGRFEVILVDQNSDDWLKPIITRFTPRLAIHHIRCERGLSKARNRGLVEVRAPFVGFPDDDCWYRPDFLERLHDRFVSDPGIAGLTGLCVDEAGRLAAGGGCRRSRRITKDNVWGLGVSATLFLRREVFEDLGGFDESLGLGARTIFQSGEETDLLLRILARGHRLRYEPRLVVYHPAENPEEPGAADKAWRYGLGMGRVLRMHRYGPLAVLEHLARPILGAGLALAANRRGLASVRWARARGRLAGWRRALERDQRQPVWPLDHGKMKSWGSKSDA